MRPSMERMLEAIVPESGRMSGTEVLRRLVECGAVDRRSVEAAFARAEVERRVRGGEGRCRAMDEVAFELCCSYEKVRSIVYSRNIP